MPHHDREKFNRFCRYINSRVGDLSENDFRIFLAALAFELYITIGAMPDEFWVTPVADTDNVTDAEVDAEDAWTQRLDALFADYLK